MNNWRTHILKEFTPQVAPLTLVADPDGLLLEEVISQEIRQRGFEIIPLEDHIAFRFAYESKFRLRWDRGEHTDLVVVLRSGSGELDCLPYDLLRIGRKLSFNLGELFPNLSYPVVASLDRGDLDALYKAQVKYNPGKMGDNSTKDFVLRHVFEIAPELIKQASDLLRVLLRRHYRGQRIPHLLDERLIEVLQQNGIFEEWPLERIVPDREAFFSFLQERWLVFLDSLAASSPQELGEAAKDYGLELSGPLHLPFDHDDLRGYIDKLFLEGILQSVSHHKSNILVGKWAAIGISTDREKDRLRRLEGLIKSIKDSLPLADSRHQEWLFFASRWAELLVLWLKLNTILPEEVRQQLEDLRRKLDKSFVAWIKNRYAGLHNQPAVPPVMLHHIPRALAHTLAESKQEKVAVVLVDGLALDQWIVLREVLVSERSNFRFRENAVFAWIPTITSISRQAAFAGKPPLYFPSSIHSTDKDPVHWTQFWLDNGLAKDHAAYVKGIGNDDLDKVEEILSHHKIRAVALVIDKVDKIMHGMELGAAGMHNQVRQWAKQGFMAELFDLLLSQGFRVYMTSDHGNVEAKGCGRPLEGAVADVRGERVRIYPDKLLRSEVKEKFPDAIEWPAIGLPDDFFPLLAPERLAFIKEGQKTVGHGSISIEELVVPFVQVERRA